MKQYKNSLGITCLEAEEGYVLVKGNQKMKKAYLGKNDLIEYYKEELDDSVIEINDFQNNESNIPGNGVILISPNGKRFKLIVNNDGSLSTKEL